MADITCDEVRYRLKMSAIDLPDAMLNSAAFIPAAAVWMEGQLGYAPSVLTGNKLTAAKVAMISYVAKKVLTTATPASARSVLISYTPADAKDRIELVAELDKEIAENLRFLGVSDGSFAHAIDTGNYLENSDAW